jgi:hypothetical protein
MVTPGSRTRLFGLADAAVICGACHEIRADVLGGSGICFEQRCSCQPRRHSEGALRGYDFPTAAELCRCCAGKLLESGSKYSVWFCEPCEHLVRTFNDEAGRCAIPIGRHSLMIPSGLPGHGADDGLAMRRFGLAIVSWAKRIDWIQAQAGAATRHNLVVLGLDPGSDVLLSDYLELVSRYDGSGLTSEGAFERLVASLDQ